jgi:hypothetical protein
MRISSGDLGSPPCYLNTCLCGCATSSPLSWVVHISIHVIVSIVIIATSVVAVLIVMVIMHVLGACHVLQILGPTS